MRVTSTECLLALCHHVQNTSKVLHGFLLLFSKARIAWSQTSGVNCPINSHVLGQLARCGFSECNAMLRHKLNWQCASIPAHRNQNRIGRLPDVFFLPRAKNHLGTRLTYCGSLMTPIGIQTAQLFIRLNLPSESPSGTLLRNSLGCMPTLFHSRLLPFALISNKCLKMVYNTSCFTTTSNEDACSQYSSSAYRSFPTPRDLEQPLSELCSQNSISIICTHHIAGRFCRVDENKNHGSLGMKV